MVSSWAKTLPSFGSRPNRVRHEPDSSLAGRQRGVPCSRLVSIRWVTLGLTPCLLVTAARSADFHPIAEIAPARGAPPPSRGRLAFPARPVSKGHAGRNSPPAGELHERHPRPMLVPTEAGLH